uniref:NADH-ubiquinone oxidoreductase chain 6 n=1 Tax=Curculionoidea sp. 10 KM-2017 TaxID=2219393 RepID=A0A346RIA1_9CUCU|nr:NADH dehydrogenase subunit 6 [Curculionoidea sp. 10 KM-2017]
MFSFMLILSFMLIFIKHPISMGLILLIQTLMISLISGKLMLNFWLSYMIMLVMIGGMLIIFIYMTSIASNEKFTINLNFFLLLPLVLLNIKFENSSNLNLLFLKNQKIEFSMNKYFMFPNNLILIFIMIYLFITMLASTKICKFNKGPLRQMF